jgi:PD-(D/E)XK nuclease superfamily protein
MTRIVSQSEVDTLMRCGMKWAFGYGDVAGFALEPKTPAIILREGRAWGAAAQAWHAIDGTIEKATAAILDSLDADAAQMEEHGTFVATEYEEIRDKLFGALAQYCATQPKLNLVASELELEVRFEEGFVYRCHLDGVHQDEDGGLWVVEFKLRRSMTPLEQVVLWRQIRWYALALAETSGQEVVGIIVDERLNAAPKPIKVNKDGSISAVQSCALEEYLDACNNPAKYGGRIVTEPNQRTVGLLGDKVWSQRHEILLRHDEMDDAVRELESAAKLIGFYDRHELLPIRVPGQQCSSCFARDLCATPQDERLRDALFVPSDYVKEVAA